MNRRGFLTRSGLALGALIVGDEVLEALDRLNHRKVWAGHTFRDWTHTVKVGEMDVSRAVVAEMLRQQRENFDYWRRYWIDLPRVMRPA